MVTSNNAGKPMYSNLIDCLSQTVRHEVWNRVVIDGWDVVWTRSREWWRSIKGSDPFASVPFPCLPFLSLDTLLANDCKRRRNRMRRIGLLHSVARFLICIQFVVDSLIQLFSAGALAGLFNSFIVTPVDRVKCLLQVRRGTTSEYKGSFDCANQLMRKEGIHSLYRGFGITIIRS
jgi:Mitochondrial carrier protein